MEDRAEYIQSLFRGCRQPVKQIRLIAELAGCEIPEVIRVLKKAKLISYRVTARNYRELLAKYQHPKVKVSEEMRHYIIGSFKRADILAKETGLPTELISQIREKAMKKAQRGKKGG